MQGAEGLSATDGCVGSSFPAESPSRALRAASWKGGIQGEGKGVRPKASQSAKDSLIEPPERDTSRPLKKATARKAAGICGCVVEAHAPTLCRFISGPRIPGASSFQHTLIGGNGRFGRHAWEQRSELLGCGPNTKHTGCCILGLT